jgi:pimeloyl-ACP methyl ester carboxylesterase
MGEKSSGYLSLRGHQIWNSHWNGAGDPVVILHGGLSATANWENYILQALAGREVFGYDRTGHGRTADQKGSFYFDFQVQEAIAYLEDVVNKPAHLVGYSDGGIIALLVALKRPDLVETIVTIGANFDPSGVIFPPEARMITQEERDFYALTSPDPAHTLDEKKAKMEKIWQTEPNISLHALGTINTPVLVMAGDDDSIKLHHTVALFEALPQARLAIIPGASHSVMKDQTEIAASIIRKFLANSSEPITRSPIRRAHPPLV